MEQEMATHSSIIAWKIPWTEKPGELKSMWFTLWEWYSLENKYETWPDKIQKKEAGFLKLIFSCLTSVVL